MFLTLLCVLLGLKCGSIFAPEVLQVVADPYIFLWTVSLLICGFSNKLHIANLIFTLKRL